MKTLRVTFVPAFVVLAAGIVTPGCGDATKQTSAPAAPALDDPNVARVEPVAVMGHVPESMKNRAPVITPDAKPARVIADHVRPEEKTAKKAAKDPEKQKLTPEERAELRRKRREERKARQQEQATQPDGAGSPSAPDTPPATDASESAGIPQPSESQTRGQETDAANASAPPASQLVQR